MHAYNEIYLDSSTRVLGNAIDYAVNELKMDIDEFAKRFIVSEVSKQFAIGNPRYIAGMNGYDIDVEILKLQEEEDKLPEYKEYLDKSPEYWCGYVLAYFQWYKDESFSRILASTKASDIVAMYEIYHEMDLMKTVEVLEANIKKRFPETRLATIRKLLAISQAELARRSGVSLRQIQLFEQRQRDINSAKLSTIYSLSKVLGCKVEELVER